MFKIALPDGSVKEMPEGSTPGGHRRGDRARARQGGDRGAGRRRTPRYRPPVRGGRTARAGHRAKNEADALELVRHDFAHILAEAVQNLYPGHADHLRPGDRRRLLLRLRAEAERGPFTEEDLPAIEEEMRRIIAATSR